MLVTGATDGIGRETAYALGKRGARVLVHGRTEARARAASAELLARGVGGEFTPVWGDLGALAQVRTLAAQVRALAPTLEVLINNAGVYLKTREETPDGFEATVGINHLAPVLLTHELWPSLVAAKAARVVNVASGVHGQGRVDLGDLFFARGYDGYAAYASSKLMNVLFTHALARRTKGTGVTTSALHPGVINTKLLRVGFGAGGAKVESGARTSVYCATAPELEGVSGRYYSDGREVPCAPQANDVKLEEALYRRSCELVGVAPMEG